MGRGILAGCICPHPPLLVPSIGGRELARVRRTVEAMELLAGELRQLDPDVIVVISPHTPMQAGRFTVKTSTPLSGDFSQFGHPEEEIVRECDIELAEMIAGVSAEYGIETARIEGDGRGRPWEYGRGGIRLLDHGVLVPLYYLGKGTDAPLVSLSISMLSYRHHIILGRVVDESCRRLKRRAVFLASGDLSHRLIPGAPAGFSPRGQDFDSAICKIAESGDFSKLDGLEESMVDEAGECGLRSIFALRGALEGSEVESRLLSYEGPFGVGYMVSLHRVVS